MIEKIKILELVNGALEGSDKFLVNLKITPDNRIFVDIDGDNGVNIDDCIALSRAIESQLDREEEVAPAAAEDSEAAEIDALVAERAAAKKAKDFARADEIRNDLAKRGIELKDGPQGTTWERKR